MCIVTFEFEGNSVPIEVPKSLQNNPVRNAVRLLRGKGFDPQESKDCFLEGMVNGKFITRYSVLNFLANGLANEGEEGFASPLVLEN